MPALALAALRKQIQDRKIAGVYLLYGPDVRLIEQMMDAIEGLVDPADRPFAVERAYAGEPGTSAVDIVAAANVFPMLGDRRIVFVLRAERFLKPPRPVKAGDAPAIEDEDIDDTQDGGALDTTAIEAYLDSPSPFTALVFVASAIDRSRRLTKRLIEKAACVEFGGLAADNPRDRRDLRNDAAAEIRKQLEAVGRTIEPAAVQLLVDRAGADISKLRGDVERLLLYTEGQTRIARSDVEEVVSVEADIDDWGIVNAIGDGDASRALKEIALRFDRGDSPHMLLGQLRWWVSQRLAAAAPDRVKPALDALLRTDLALKSSGGDDRVLVERLVVELTGRPLPRPAWGR